MLKNKNNSKVNGTVQKSPSINMISEGTRIKGTINSQNDIRIAGKLDGEAVCKGKIIITSSAYIEGNITSSDADIAGNVGGTIKTSNKLILRQSADISGDVYAKILIVEEGAQINGNFKMGEGSESLDAATDTEFAGETKVKKQAEK